MRLQALKQGAKSLDTKVWTQVQENVQSYAKDCKDVI